MRRGREKERELKEEKRRKTDRQTECGGRDKQTERETESKRGERESGRER